METKKYTCIICNKIYKTYKSMWHHKNKYHKNEKNNDQNMTTYMHDDDQSMTINDHSNINNINSVNENDKETKLTDNKICMYCKKTFSAYTHMRRHLKSCKSKDNIIKQNEELKNKIEKMEQSFEKLKKQMIDMMNQNKIVD